MKTFSHSHNDRPWDHLHCGYISAPAGSNARGVRKKGLSTRTRLKLDPDVSAEITRGFQIFPDDLRDDLFELTGQYHLTVADDQAMALVDWLTRCGYEVSAEEA